MAPEERVYRLLLRLYPAEFREEYGREMTQMFRDRTSFEPPARVWFDVVRDLAITVPRERFRMLLTDASQSLKAIRSSRGFSLAVVCTVALVIAVNTAMFSVVNAVLIRPFPFAAPNRLVEVAESNDRLSLPNFAASVLNFVFWREHALAFERLGAVGFDSFYLGGPGEGEQIWGNRLSPSLLPMLGLDPVVGRGFTDAEERPGAPPVVMIGERLWARRFHRDPAVVGRRVSLNGAPSTIVGVVPAALNGLYEGEIYVPLTIDLSRENRLNHLIVVHGRLKDGVTLADAQAECAAIAARMHVLYPELQDWSIRLFTLRDTVVNPQFQRALLILLGAVGFVLLVACGNITNLLLARSIARQKEIAVRTALGASRHQLLRLLFVESVTLSGLGGLLGVAAAVAAIRAINGLLPEAFLPLGPARLDATVLLFGVGLTIATGIIFGMAPALHAAKTDVNDMLKPSGRGTCVAGGRLRPALAAFELALATTLLVGAGLLIQTFLNLQHTRLGFDSHNRLTFELAPPTTKYPVEKASQYYRALLDDLRSIPGVLGAAVSSGVPLGDGNTTKSPMAAVAPSVLPPDTPVAIDYRIVSPAFFQTMRIPIVAGRDFTDRDDRSVQVVIVSQATARIFWGDERPIGRVLRRTIDGRLFTVVGVVGDVHANTLNDESPVLYYPMARGVFQRMDIVVQTAGSPATRLDAIRQTLRDVDAEVPVSKVRTMDEWISESAMQPRLVAAVVAVFAILALLIAAIGIYGVLAYSVNQRAREIALRVALGARRRRVVRLIVKEGMTVAIAGIAIGLAGSLGLGRGLSSLVYGLSPDDPLTFGSVAAVLAVVSLAACAVPASRAARVDPMIVLRDE